MGLESRLSGTTDRERYGTSVTIPIIQLHTLITRSRLHGTRFPRNGHREKKHVTGMLNPRESKERDASRLNLAFSSSFHFARCGESSLGGKKGRGSCPVRDVAIAKTRCTMLIILLCILWPRDVTKFQILFIDFYVQEKFVCKIIINFS